MKTILILAVSALCVFSAKADDDYASIVRYLGENGHYIISPDDVTKVQAFMKANGYQHVWEIPKGTFAAGDSVAQPTAAAEAVPSSGPVPAPSGVRVFDGLIIGGVFLALLCFFAKIIPSICNVHSNQSPPLPPPTPSESANQELVLADLEKGATPNRYQLDGFLPKKGEHLIWAFVGVKHYRQGTHSEWVGRSSGASVRVCRGLWVRSGSNRGHRVSHSQMDYQGAGILVLTTIGLCFIGGNSTRIPLSHILAFQSYTDGIGFDTDYARNNRHVFTQIHAGNVAFIQTVLEIIKAA
jgi:hypothetical protein